MADVQGENGYRDMRIGKNDADKLGMLSEFISSLHCEKGGCIYQECPIWIICQIIKGEALARCAACDMPVQTTIQQMKLEPDKKYYCCDDCREAMEGRVMTTDVQFTDEDFDDLLCEIKGLLVDISGKPNRTLTTEAEVDSFIDEIETLINEKSKLAAKYKT